VNFTLAGIPGDWLHSPLHFRQMLYANSDEEPDILRNENVECRGTKRMPLLDFVWYDSFTTSAATYFTLSSSRVFFLYFL
jgi:hypothetical protein